MGDGLGEVCEAGDFILGYGHDYIVLKSSATHNTPGKDISRFGNDSVYHVHNIKYSTTTRCQVLP